MQNYSGITVILSNPSRFDLENRTLLSGTAGFYFDKWIAPLTRNQCHIRLLDNEVPFLEGTKLVFLLGSDAHRFYFPENSSLNQYRGIPQVKDGIIFLSSYSPQEAMDMGIRYESKYNPAYQSALEEGDDDPLDTKSTKGGTTPKHFRFWLWQDCKKLIRLWQNPSLEPKIKSVIETYPNIDKVIAELDAASDQDLYLDIEIYPNFKMSCIGLTIGLNPTVYVIPFQLFSGSLPFRETQMAKFLVALCSATHRNCVVIHNSMFDLLILSVMYRLPIGRKVYDTMLAHSRLWPDTEKSLGHCISLYTNLGMHKNDGVFLPKNSMEQEQLWRYNGNDVASMREIKIAQELEAKRLGAEASVAQVNRMVYPYLVSTIYGSRLNQEAMLQKEAENSAKLEEYKKILRILCGQDILPTSSKSLTNYFHKYLKYPVVKVSEKSGEPGLGKGELYKLMLEHKNPIIPLCVEYKRLSKESGTLKTRPWWGNLQDTRLCKEPYANPIADNSGSNSEESR